MATITFDSGAVWDNNNTTNVDKYTTRVPGLGRRRTQVVTGRGGDLSTLGGSTTQGFPLEMVTGTFDFDSSYPSGGESISEIWNLFTHAYIGSVWAQPNVSGCKCVKVDTNNKKLQAYSDGFVTEATGNLSAVTGVRFIAWGY